MEVVIGLRDFHQQRARERPPASVPEHAGRPQNPQIPHQIDRGVVARGQPVGVNDRQGEAGALQKSAEVAHIGEWSNPRTDPARDLGFGDQKRVAQLAERVSAEHRGEKQAVGLESVADLDQGAGQVVDVVKRQCGGEQREFARRQGKPLFIEHGTGAPGMLKVVFREVRGAYPAYLAGAGEGVCEDAPRRAQGNAGFELTVDAVEPVCELGGGRLEQKVFCRILPGAPDPAYPEELSVENCLAGRCHGWSMRETDTMTTATNEGETPHWAAGGRHAVSGALSRLGSALLALVLPPQCLGCRARTASHPGLCQTCWSQIDFIEPPLCPRTGQPFAYDPGPGTVSAAALARPPAWHSARAAVCFGPVSRRLVHALKYQDRLEVAGLLGRLMARAGSALLDEADLIVPVPLYRGRLWARRYNQSALLAAEIGAQTDVPVVLDALRRTRPTRAQVGLNIRERRRNVRAAFALDDGRQLPVLGKRVVLVDDVITTGATAEACADALLDAGASQVDVLAFALVVNPLKVGV